MRPQEERQEHRTGEQVHDSVPDNLASRANHVATVAEGPDDEVNRPDEGQEESGA